MTIRTVLLLGAFALNANAGAPSAEEFGRLPAVSNVLLSPSGSHFAAVRSVKGKPFLAIHDFSATDGDATEFMALKLRKDLDEKVRTLHWLNEETVGIVFEFDGNRQGVPTTETRLIAMRRDFSWGSVLPRAKTDGLYNTQLAHKILDFLPDDPEHILMVLDRSGTGHELNVYRVSLNDASFRTRDVGGAYVAAYDVDQQGRVRLRVDVQEDERRLYTRDPDGRKWRLLERADRTAGFEFSPVGFADNPSRLLVLSLNDSGRAALFEYDIAQSRLSNVVHSDPGLDVLGVERDPYTRKLIGVRKAADYPVIHYLDPELQKVQQEVDSALTDTTNTLSNFDRSRKQFVVHATSPRHPGTYYLYTRKEKTLRPLAASYKQLGSDDLYPVKAIDYDARDGLKIRGYLTRPSGNPPHPLILLPHGGPTARDYLRFDYMAQFLASRGYAVLQPNFRGSTGYGEDFQAAGRGEWGLKMQDDLEDGTRAMIERGVADADRICIVGWSYGGYAALIATVKTPRLFACAVSGAGVSDIRRMLKEHSRYKFATKNPPSIGHIRKDKDKLRDNSPINGVDAIEVPVLLVHGDKDLVVSVEHSKRMARILKKFGKPHRLVILEDGDHHLSAEPNRIRFLKELEVFLATHLAPRAKSPSPPGVTRESNGGGGGKDVPPSGAARLRGRSIGPMSCRANPTPTAHPTQMTRESQPHPRPLNRRPTPSEPPDRRGTTAGPS